MDGGYGFEFDCGCDYDGKSVSLLDRHLVGVDALEKIARLPSFLGTASCNEGEGMSNVEGGMVANASYNRTLWWEFAWMSNVSGELQSLTYLTYEVVKQTLVRATSDPCHKDWGSFEGSAGPGHRNPYRAASHGRVVHPWGDRENAGDNHVACLLVRPCVSIPLAAVVGLSWADPSRILVETVDEIVHRVLERRCPHLAECRNLQEAVAHARKMLCGRGQNVLDGGKVTVYRCRVS